MGQERVFQMSMINQECEFQAIKSKILKADQSQFSKERKLVKNHVSTIFVDHYYKLTYVQFSEGTTEK